jgi:hypothetical protein
VQVQDSFVPAGLGLFIFILPAIETAGYFQSPRCGWKQKGILADAFAILFEEFSRYALSPT